MSLVPGVGGRRFIQIIEKFGDVGCFLENASKYEKLKGMNNELLLRVAQSCYDIDIKVLLSELEGQGTGYIVYGEEDYPYLLSKIHSPPIVLFYKGDKTLLNKFCISIVGTRGATAYGANIVSHIINGIKDLELVTVSGMAFGIDTIVHRKSLDVGLPTVAVLGSSLSNPMPYSNIDLFEEISRFGLVISEYPIGREIHPSNFVQRNRIIAGLSKGLVVVEAGEKSGALITAQFAFEENREVFAFPGDINRQSSQGTNNLIKRNKANLVTSYKDVIEFLGLGTNKVDKVDLEKLDGNEKRVFELLFNAPLDEEEILDKIDILTSDLLASLTIMESKGYIYRNERGKFCVVV